MLTASSPVPPLAYQDYPVDLHLRIYRSGPRYGADVLAEGQCARVDIDLSPDDLAALNREMQEAVEELALEAAAERASPAAVAKEHLLNLAELGNYAFRKVFGHRDAAYLPEFLESRPFALQVASEDFFLPWELLYPSLDAPLDYANFLGLGHVVSRVIVQDGRRGAFVPPAIPVAGQPRLGLLTYNTLPDVSGKELGFFEGLAGQGKIVLRKLRPLDAEKKKEGIEEFRLFWKEPLSLAHLACEAVYEDQFPNRSHILLSDEFPVTLQDMEIYRVVIDSHPLLVLNACKTGTMNPLYTSHFAGAFLRSGARGVVATECLVPDAFAADFVQLLYEHLLAGRPLGESMLAARRFFLAEQGNPSGLLYSMYASPSIRLVL
jgi:hypothetical protein